MTITSNCMGSMAVSLPGSAQAYQVTLVPPSRDTYRGRANGLQVLADIGKDEDLVRFNPESG